MTVGCKYVVAHASLQRDHGDDIHSCVTKLQGDHCQVGFKLIKPFVRHPTCHLYRSMADTQPRSLLHGYFYLCGCHHHDEKEPSYRPEKQYAQHQYKSIDQHFLSLSLLDSLIHLINTYVRINSFFFYSFFFFLFVGKTNTIYIYIYSKT
jgi:hypothetical protein